MVVYSLRWLWVIHYSQVSSIELVIIPIREEFDPDARNHCLLTGTSPTKQIESIFEIIGTPREDDWPSIHSDLKSCSLAHIPQSPGRDLSSLAPRLDPNGIDLLKSLLQCNPSKRISSTAAILHNYFESLPKAIYELSDSESIFSIPEITLNPEQTSSNISQPTSSDAGI